MKVNIAIAGGQCTGKSTVAAALFAHLKTNRLDYDLISEEKRKLAKEFGNFQSPFERIYMWRQQEREELRSTASDGFITDAPLFQLYTSAKMHASQPREDLAVRELFRMCMEIKDRYHLIVIAKNPLELPYLIDGARKSNRGEAVKHHIAIASFVEHFWPDRILQVEGPTKKRIKIIEDRLKEMGQEFRPLPYR